MMLEESRKIVKNFVHEIEKRVSKDDQISELRKVKEVALLKRRVIEEIYEEFDVYLVKNYKRPISFYKKKMIELNKDLCTTIADVENISLSSVFESFESIIEKKSKEYEKQTGKFIFLKEKDGITDDTIQAFKNRGYNVVVNTFFPFSLLRFDETSDVKRLINLYKLIFVLTRVSVAEKEEGEESKEKQASLGQKLFENILFSAIAQGASDVHIVPHERAYYVYFRINGLFLLQQQHTLSLEHGDSLITYLMRRASEEVGGQFNPDSRMTYQDARIRVPEAKTMGVDLDVRLAFVPDGTPQFRTDVCMRLLCKTKKETKKDASVEEALTKLGYLEEDATILENMLYKRNGIVVVSGITNSGKSTLVSTLLSFVKDKKIGTIEDPIEYYVDNPNYIQHQIFISDKEKIKMDFVDYVKAFKRSDYDIVFIGEWRQSKGLADALIEQAYAGQLIFTTLHIGTSFQMFEALKSIFGVDPEKIKPILLLSWNQILVPKLCQNCKKEVINYNVSAKVLSIVKNSASVTDDVLKRLERFQADVHYVRGEGCEKCKGTGYEGRQVIYDYFVPTVDMWEKLNGDYSSFNVLKNAKIKKTKFDVFFEMAEKGVVSMEDFYFII